MANGIGKERFAARACKAFGLGNLRSQARKPLGSWRRRESRAYRIIELDMKMARILLTAALISLVTLFAMARNAAGNTDPPGLFESNQALVLAITAPWRELVKDVEYQGAYPAQIEYTDGFNKTVMLDLTVERRGVKRQQVCKIPPIKLRFEKGTTDGTVFRGQQNLKMVTHCQLSSGYEQYYILEMLAYRIYNLLTDYSFRVRPLTVTYYQTGAENEKESRFSFFNKKKSEGPVFAFLIEEDKDVANRFDLKNLHIPRISPSQLDSDEAALFALFQFLIGNVDWAATMGPDPEECCHNTKLIGPEPTRVDDILYAIPYDFDSSGLVDSEYAAPPDSLPIRRVTQRLYRGYCAHNSSLDSARKKIIASEQAIYQLFEEEDGLDAGTRNKAIRFLAGFFEIIKDDADFQTQVVEQCRQ